jgi:DNA polymerase-1
LEDWPNLRPTPADLDRLFPKDRELNVGLLLGSPSQGLLDIDLDCAEAIAVAPLLLPATGWVSGRAGRPRSHWWYLVSDPPDKAQDKYTDLDGTDLLEIRSTGGQTVAPPGVHESGEAIIWYATSGPATVERKDLVSAARATAAAALLARHWPKLGARQDAFLALAGGLLRAGWEPGRVERFLGALAAATGDEESRKRVQIATQTAEKLAKNEKVTGWPKLAELLGGCGREILGRVWSWLGISSISGISSTGPEAENAQWGNPVEVELPPPVLFPLYALPAPMRSFAAEMAAVMPCPPDLPALIMLATAGQAIGRTHIVRVRSDWFEGAQVWGAAVLPPSGKKSPAFRAVMRPVFQAQTKLIREYEAAVDQFEIDLATFEAELAAYKKERTAAIKKGEDPPKPPIKPKPPPRRQLFTSDTTREAFTELLLDNPRGVGLFRDELSGFALALNQYRAGGRGDDRQFWLSQWSGEACPINRKGRRIWLPNPFACVCGCIQPDVLHKLQPESGIEDGFVARFLYAWPDPVKPIWTGLEIHPDTVAAYESLVEKLLALPLYLDDFGDTKPSILRLNPEATRRFAAWVDELADDIAGEELPDNLKMVWGKLQGYTARLSLVLHVCRVAAGEAEASEPIVDLASVEAAIELVRYFQAHARRVYLRLGSAAAVAGERDVERVLDWIGRHRGRWADRTPPSFTWREVFHDLHKTFWDRPKDLETALKVLEDRGHVREVLPPSGGRGRKAKKIYEIHPETGRRNAHNRRNAPPTPRTTTSDDHFGHFDHFVYRSNGDHERGGPVDGDLTVGDNGAVDAPIDTAPYTLIANPADLAMVVTAVGESALVGLDTETTGLDPRTDRVRLLSLACDTIDGGTVVYVVDCFAVPDLSPLWEPLGAATVVGHNLSFDLPFLAKLGFAVGICRDTLLMSQVLHAGNREVRSHKLADSCSRELQETIDKTEQTSDWSGSLTDSQLRYAARDAEVVRRLDMALMDKLKKAGLNEAAAIECGALPAVTWLASGGVGFDRPSWDALAEGAAAEADRLSHELDQIAPPPPGELFDGGWKWDSPADVTAAFKAVGCDLADTHDSTLAALDHSLATALREYRAAKKLATTYGSGWLKDGYVDGRVYARWWQLGAGSGRMACSSPNLQNLPRDPRYRRCFTAPPGRVLVKADYSQIELRIAAKVANETNMIEAYRRGDDLHTLTARRLVGRDDVTKADRQLAKAVNFGLLYGMGARGFRSYARAKFGVELTEERAQQYRTAFFAAYPALAAWHRKVGRTEKRPVETRTLSGRRVLNVESFNEKLNSPVQGTGADGLKRTLALLWDRRTECPGAVPVLVVHDELVVECDAVQADVVSAWLRQAMLDGMAPLVDPVPVEVEVSVGRTWAGDCD